MPLLYRTTTNPKFSVVRILILILAIEFTIAVCCIDGLKSVSGLESYFVFVSFNVFDTDFSQIGRFVMRPLSFNVLGLGEYHCVDKQVSIRNSFFILIICYIFEF